MDYGLQVCVELVGYLLEELRDAKNFANFQKDVASGACSLLMMPVLLFGSGRLAAGQLGTRGGALPRPSCPPC